MISLTPNYPDKKTRYKINNKKYRRAVVITFDDGYKDNYLYVYPILKKYKSFRKEAVKQERTIIKLNVIKFNNKIL